MEIAVAGLWDEFDFHDFPKVTFCTANERAGFSGSFFVFWRCSPPVTFVLPALDMPIHALQL
jgi:hypothetical protein